MSIFDKIYKYNLWVFGSGSGSIPINNKPYINFLNNFLINYNIKSIIDIGCGDWQISKNINWNNTKYLGIDIVKDVIDKNLKKYSSENINFICEDILKSNNLPDAECYILKDVLQHLPNEKIFKILKILSSKNYKFIIIVSDTSVINLNTIDIFEGLYRPVDISKKPYNIQYFLKKSYIEKFYLIIYFLIFLYILYLFIRKTDKFSYFLIVFIIIGFMIPRKNIYVIKKNK